MITFLMILSLPIVIVGNSVILLVFVGWPGIVGIGVALVLLWMNSRVSEWNGETVNEANEFKDKRVSAITETIEGIKHIKLYGW